MPQAEQWRQPESLVDRGELGTKTGLPPIRSLRLEAAAEPAQSASARPAPSSAHSWRPAPGSEAREAIGAGPCIMPTGLGALVHDARNMVCALEIYCDMLEEPGVLGARHWHFADELRRLGAANRRLLEALASFSGKAELPQPDGRNPDASRIRMPETPHDVALLNDPSSRLRSRRYTGAPGSTRTVEDRGSREGFAASRAETAQDFENEGSGGGFPGAPSLSRSGRRRAYAGGQPVVDLADELRANRNLLAALVGHAVTLGLSSQGGSHPIAMTSDDLTRVLVNLARNAAEAMPGGGHLQIALEESADRLTISFADNGPGIPERMLETIFCPGFSTHIGLLPERQVEDAAWPIQHRGLGLSIVRSLVSAAGGTAWAANRNRPRTGLERGLKRGLERDGERHGSNSPVEAEGGWNPAEQGAVILIEFPIAAQPKGREEG